MAAANAGSPPAACTEVDTGDFSEGIVTTAIAITATAAAATAARPTIFRFEGRRGR